MTTAYGVRRTAYGARNVTTIDLPLRFTSCRPKNDQVEKGLKIFEFIFSYKILTQIKNFSNNISKSILNQSIVYIKQ